MAVDNKTNLRHCHALVAAKWADRIDPNEDELCAAMVRFQQMGTVRR